MSGNRGGEVRGVNGSEGGFTLLEVIVAIAIISMLTAVFGPLIVSSVQRIQWAGERMQELYDIRSGMERKLAEREKAHDQPTIWITSQNGYKRDIVGIIVEHEGLVSFLPKD